MRPRLETEVIQLGCAALLIGGLALSACGPKFDQNPQIAAIERSLENGRNARPDCFITDADLELGNLVAGRDTYKPRQLPPIIDKSMVNIVLQARDNLRKALQAAAKKIQTYQTQSDRGRALGDFYDQIQQKELESAGIINPKGAELRAELLSLAECHTVKRDSLLVPFDIEELRQQKK